MSDFLGRWSRRKRGLEREAPPAPEAPPAAAPQARTVPEAVPGPEPEFDPASLPPLESLDAGGDLSAFLHPKVPALLRQAALRRVWAADPAIRDFIGPADYAWDYNAPDGVPGFAPGLGGMDARELLARAIGAPLAEPAPDQGAAPPMTGPPAEAPAIAVAPENPLRLSEASPGAPPEPPPESPVLAGPPAPDPSAPPSPVPEPTGPEPPGPAVSPAGPPPRRRHGGALPRLG